MEATLSASFASAPFMVSFLAGMLTFLSPCVLPLIPAYLSYISGISLKELRHSSALTMTERWKIFRSALLFVFGFSLVFILLGASMAKIIGNIFSSNMFAYIAGGIIVIFGLHVAHIIQIPFLNYERRADVSGNISSLGGFGMWLGANFAPFLLGISFALGWTPCIGPIFAGIVSMAATESSQGILLMSVYAAGLGVPFLLSAVLISVMIEWLNRMKAYMRAIEIASGVLLMLIGILVATGGLGKLSAWFLELLG
ncbi:MAG: cytochrome c biogenesis protein CcdA [Wolinella sp.]